MAVDYPNYDQQKASEVQWIDDLKLDRSVAGTARARSFYITKKRRFIVRHSLTDAQFLEFETFYDDNREEEINFHWCRDPDDAEPWVCIFEGPPSISTDELGHVTVQVILAQI